MAWLGAKRDPELDNHPGGALAGPQRAHFPCSEVRLQSRLVWVASVWAAYWTLALCSWVRSWCDWLMVVESPRAPISLMMSHHHPPAQQLSQGQTDFPWNSDVSPCASVCGSSRHRAAKAPSRLTAKGSKRTLGTFLQCPGPAVP